MPMRAAHILVEGLVQGVGFRAWVMQEAIGSGLTGWVRNRRTGAVEAVIAGDVQVVGAMLEQCRRGPQHARVDALYLIADVTDGSLGSFGDFEVRPTA